MSSSEEDNNVEADSSQTKDGLELDDSQDHKVSSCPQLDTNRRSTSRRDQNENSAQAQANGSNSRIPSEPPRKVIISHKSIGKDDWIHFSTILLPHPKKHGRVLFLYDTRTDGFPMEVNTFVYEILVLSEEEGLSSWFLGDFVTSDGDLYVFTPIDPIFFALSAMIQSKSEQKQAKPLMDYFMEFFPIKFANTLTKRISQEQIRNIAEIKVSGDTEAYLLDEEKALVWLTTKVENVAKYFQQKKLTRSEASVSSNFIRPTESDDKSNEEYIRYACDLVCEYVDDSLKLKLQSSLGIPTDFELRQKRKNGESEQPNKRLKTENGGIAVPIEDYGSSNAGAKSASKGVSTKQKQLQQAAKGTRSLFNYFSPK